MKTLRDIIVEKLKISPSTMKDTTKIPGEISRADENIFKRVYSDLKQLMQQRGVSHYGDTDPYEDLTEWENYIKKELPQRLQNKESIWAFISCSLGYDYMFDEEDDVRWDEGYLSQEFEDIDPIYELAFRAISDLQY